MSPVILAMAALLPIVVAGCVERSEQSQAGSGMGVVSSAQAEPGGTQFGYSLLHSQIPASAVDGQVHEY